MFYKFGETFRWFMGRVVDIKDPRYLGRVKVRIINDQTGEVGKKKSIGGTSPKGITDEDLLWAWPLSAVQSASLSWRKVTEMEEFDTPDWIDAVGLSPTGIALSTYVFGFYLDGHEQNIPVIFGTYHKESRYPEPLTDIPTGEKSMLQLEKNPEQNYFYSDVAGLAKGFFVDQEANRVGNGQTLPKEPYTVSTLWKKGEKDQAVVDEFPTAYNTEYPYNTTYTTKSGHAIELDDTPGHERIHIWHRSGCYEEISNGPSPFLDGDTRSSALVSDWPQNGPSGYSYKTAGGVAEPDYKGRRSRKTMDSSFDVVGKDYNQLIKRDHNIEVANTESKKIGNTTHLTVGWSQPPSNRINDNGKTNYSSGGLDKYNLYLDVANNTTITSGNNYQLEIGYTPTTERRFKDDDKFNYLLDVANNSIQNIANNLMIGVGNTRDNERQLTGADTNSLFIDVFRDYTTVVGNNRKINIGGNQSEYVDGNIMSVSRGTTTMISDEGEIKIEGHTGVSIGKEGTQTTILGNLFVEGSMGARKGLSATITDTNGEVFTFINGVLVSKN